MEDRSIPDPARLYEALRDERNRQQLSQEWVGAKIGSILGARPLTKQAVSQWEKGVETPSEDSMRAWVAALGQPASWFDRWSVFRETEDLRERMKTRGLASDDDIELAVRLLRRIQAGR